MTWWLIAATPNINIKILHLLMNEMLDATLGTHLDSNSSVCAYLVRSV